MFVADEDSSCFVLIFQCSFTKNQIALLGFIREPESETGCLSEVVQAHAKSKFAPPGRVPDILQF